MSRVNEHTDPVDLEVDHGGHDFALVAHVRVINVHNVVGVALLLSHRIPNADEPT